jgi:hypothetical protein
MAGLVAAGALLAAACVPRLLLGGLAAAADQLGEIEAAQTGREASGPDRAGRPENVGSG